MRILIIFLWITTNAFSSSPDLPEGVTMDTIPCTLAVGLNSHKFYKGNEMIGYIEPTGCNPSYFEETETTTYYIADFYIAYQKDTFTTEAGAIEWMANSITDYYKPVNIDKWQTLKSDLPKVMLEYPVGWTYRTNNSDSFFGSKSNADNRLTIMVPTRGGTSEIFLIIRTPNTDKMTTSQVMDWTAMWIRDLDFKTNPAKDIVIGGKTFKAAENIFMVQMYQHHYWYADNEEIIYINYNMLKEEQVWYPVVLEEILKSIKL
jgi:hypothetical protein